MNTTHGSIAAVAGVSLVVRTDGAAMLTKGRSVAARPVTLLSAPAATSSPAPATTNTVPQAKYRFQQITRPPVRGTLPICDAVNDDGGGPSPPPAVRPGSTPVTPPPTTSGTDRLASVGQNDRHQVWSGVLTTAGTFSVVDVLVEVDG